MSARVVSLFPNKPGRVLNASPQFDQAWQAFPESGRLRSSKKLALPEWEKVARDIGQDDLLGRVRRYSAEDKDHRKECGAPAFHRWLNWGRWEHWAPLAPKLVAVSTFPYPELRANFFEVFPDDRARRWFDLCDLTASREIVAPAARSEWVYGPFKAWAVANKINGIKFR